MNYNGWNRFGVSRGGPSDPTSPTALTTSFQVFACTARDAAGDVPLTPSTTSGAVQEITFGKTTSTEGGVIFPVEVDYHYFSETDTTDNIYVCLKTSATAVKVKHIRVTWRA